MLLKKITYRFLYTFLILIATAPLIYAQPGSGGEQLPCDPDSECPLDTYVWLLAIIALIFGAVYLYRQQKEQSRVN